MSLAALDLTAESLAGLAPDEQFARVRQAWLAKALTHHPDKGGDAATFRSIRAAFDALRAAHKAGESLTEVGVATDKGGSIRCHEFYAAAVGEELPGYKFMFAPSATSKCTKTGEPIAKGELRVGPHHPLVGYGFWSKLSAWRVPGSIHLALPTEGADLAAFDAALAELEGVTLVGYTSLDAETKAAIAAHVANKENHARLTAKAVAKFEAAAKKAVEAAEAPAGAPTALAVVSAAEQALPRPGVDGVAPNQLVGASCVLTGVFDASGGAGFGRGKDGIKDWVESHGGKVVGSISKKTTHLIVGRLPGASKLNAGRAMGAKLVTPETLAAGLRAGDVPAAIAGAPPIDVESLELSKGFGKNAKAIEFGGEPSAKRLKM